MRFSIRSDGVVIGREISRALHKEIGLYPLRDNQEAWVMALEHARAQLDSIDRELTQCRAEAVKET